MKQGYVYILASKKNGTLYVGVTSNLARRIFEHKNDLIDGFSKKYQIHDLVYYEVIPNLQEAILREKQLKKATRKYKINLIENFNLEWKDLYESIFS